MVGLQVVLKPAELTPMTAVALAVLAQRAGVPDGCLNLVFGDAAAIGESHGLCWVTQYGPEKAEAMAVVPASVSK